VSDTITYVQRANQDESIEEMLRSHRADGIKHWQAIWDKATKLQKFANGDHWTEADKKRVDRGPSKSPRLSINEIDPILQTFSGRQMMQRFERSYMPRHMASARQGEVMTQVDRAFMQATDAEQVESSAFKDGPGIQGISCIRWELDDLNQRGGGIMLTDAPIWQMMADPQARAVNLSDRAWHRFGSWWGQTTVRERWPEKWQQIVGSMGAATWKSEPMGESSRIPWVGMAGNKPLEPYFPRGRCFWVEYEEWRDIVTYWEVVVPVDPSKSYSDTQREMMEAKVAPDAPKPSDPYEARRVYSLAEVQTLKDQHFAKFAEEIPKDKIFKGREAKFKYAYVIGEVVVETGDVPTNYWTFQFFTGTRFPQPNTVEWRSLVERLVDAQKWVDVFLTAQIRNVQITPKGLLFVEEGFFKNRNEALDSWARPGGLIVVGRGKLTSGSPGYKFESGGTQSYASMIGELMSFAREALPRLAGFNPAALGQVGSDIRRISGEVVRQLQDSAMTSNAEMFDNLRNARREGGRIFLAFLRKFFTLEDVVRIVGEENAFDDQLDANGQPIIDPATGQPARVPVIPPPDTWRPDYWREIAVEDVVPTGDQLQAVWKALETSMPTLMQPQPDTGRPVFSSEDIAEMVPGIPAQRRAKIIQRIQRDVKAMMAQQAPPPPGGGEPGAEGGAEGASVQ